MVKFVFPAVVLFLIIGAYLLGPVTLPFVIAAVLAYVFQPVIKWFERFHIPRWLGTLMVTAFVIALITLFSVYTLPLLYGQLINLIMKLPVYFDQIKGIISALFIRLYEYLPHAYYDQIQDNINSLTKDIVPLLFSSTQSLFLSSLNVIHYITLIFLLPVLTFYFMKDWPKLIDTLIYYLPPKNKRNIILQAKEIDRTIAGFARGQATVCLILAVYYGFALHVVGLDFGFLIGVLTGIFAFVPYVGAILGFSIAAAIAWLQFSPWLLGDSGSLALFIVVSIVFAFGQFVEGAILSPNIVGRSIRLHPLWVVFALFVGGKLFGFTGVLVATPMAGAFGVILRHALSAYRKKIYKQPARRIKKTFSHHE